MSVLPGSIRVGGEVDDDCHTCKLNLAHTILAMVGDKVERVQCNTCGSQHRFRSSQPLQRNSFAAPKAPAAARARATPRPKKNDFDDAVVGKDVSRARRYAVSETFAVDEVVDHLSFGLGVVTAVRGDKVDVVFRAGVKTLAHGK